jgi:hypothetical protein
MNPEDLFVGEGATVREALERVSKTGKGLTLVVDGQRRLVGIATDGDLRKAILRGAPLDAGIERRRQPRAHRRTVWDRRRRRAGADAPARVPPSPGCR